MIVFEYKVCSLEYFLDKLQAYELEAICNNLEINTKQDWERTRFSSYVQAQTQTTKSLKPQDLIKFSWDENKKVTVSQEDRERLTRKIKELEKLKQDGRFGDSIASR